MARVKVYFLEYGIIKFCLILQNYECVNKKLKFFIYNLFIIKLFLFQLYASMIFPLLAPILVYFRDKKKVAIDDEKDDENDDEEENEYDDDEEAEAGFIEYILIYH